MAAITHAFETEPCAHHIVQALSSALKEKKIDSEINNAVLFLNLSEFESNVEALGHAFRGIPKVLHAFAIKSCPLVGILKEANRLGLGAECASIVEVKHAIKCKFEPKKIVFDSPAKTNTEISFCLQNNILLNCDSLDEIARVHTEIKNLGERNSKNWRVGVRVNPQLGMGSIEATSTASKTSKFGVALHNHRKSILQAFKKYDWLKGLHVHVGSQGCPEQMLVDGVRAIVDLANEINTCCGKEQVTILDIGGGLSINYNSMTVSPTFQSYSDMLQQQVPELWTGKFEVITEFGRSLITKAGFIATHVTAVKMAADRRIAVCHAGADLFLRTAYQPEKWQHRISVLCHKSTPSDTVLMCERDSEKAIHDIAGPLCFSGDLIARSRLISKIEVGDWLVIHDAGGYTICMHSRYNSRCSPAVYMYSSSDTDGITLKKIRNKEAWEEVSKFWE